MNLIFVSFESLDADNFFPSLKAPANWPVMALKFIQFNYFRIEIPKRGLCRIPLAFRSNNAMHNSKRIYCRRLLI